MLILFLLNANIATAFADDCGLTNVNMQDQNSIIAVQTCLKSTLTELKSALTNHGTLTDEFRNRANEILDEEGMCRKLESYWRNADADEKPFVKQNALDCQRMFNKRVSDMNNFLGTFGEMKEEAHKIEVLIQHLQVKYDLLSSQLEFVRRMPNRGR